MSHQNRYEAENLLHRFLEGELSPEEEKVALYMIAEDEKLRSSLRFERYLNNTLSEEADFNTFAVPEGFTDDVMTRIQELDTVSSREKSWFDNVLQLIRGWFAPRQYTFRPALIYVVPAILIITYTGLFQGNYQQIDMDSGTEISTGLNFVADEQLEADETWIRFVYIDDEAEQVAVAGDFSDWNPVEMNSQLMNGKKVWTGLILVERGEHHYMFVKDGVEWLTDPLADVQRDDGFGNKNAVIYL